MFIKRIQRPVAATVLVAFLSLVLQPLAVLAQDRPAGNRAAARSETGEEKFSRTLNEIHDTLKELAPQAAMPHIPRGTGEKQLPATSVADKVKQLRAKARQLYALEAEVRKGFDATERHIKEKKLPAVILARHQEALRAYEARSAEFKVLVNNLERAAEDAAPLQGPLNELAAFMAKYPNQKTHTPTDPNNLPWGSPKPVKRAPYTTPEQFKTSGLFKEHEEQQLARRIKEKKIKLAQSGSLSGIGLPGTQLPATPEPADLAETEDVQLTPAIRAKAAELGNQPVAIYNWVRNNIEFIPSYGSIQGSDMTLQTKRGNAFDTASLLIALLRAANIPARYVYGTIEVPVEQAMNWVGGVTVPDAAQQLMGQGGIPNIGIASAGQVTAIQLEHVWVEAYVDYVPSRGAVHRQGDTWVPLDTSFKRYQFVEGMNLRANVALDVQSFLAGATQGATVNEQEGSFQNPNLTSIQNNLADYQTRLTSYIDAQKQNATLGDALGTRQIIQDFPKILYGTLGFKTVAVGSRFQEIPDKLRWKFRYEIYANEFDRATGSPILSLLQSTPRLAGKRITTSYAPASQQDFDTINSYLPTPHVDGTPIELSEYPQSLPGYLVRLAPELRLDGEVLGTGAAVTMGTQLIQTAAYFNAAFGQWEAGADNTPIAGEYIATALDLQGTSIVQASSLADRVSATLSALDQFRQTGTTALLSARDKEHLVGDVLYSAILNYFITIDRAAAAAATGLGIVTNRMPSFGNFGLGFTPSYLFGTPRSVAFTSFVIDVDRISGIEVSNNGSTPELLAFRRIVGQQFSAHEHLIPERFFTTATDASPQEAVSAVKAIAAAGAAGQKIYTLTSANQAYHSDVLGQLSIDSAIKAELSSALAAGKEATVHQSAVTIGGYSGVGYIIIDPDTGAGAYKIAGGASGGDLVSILRAALGALLGLVVSPAHAADPVTIGHGAGGIYEAFKVAQDLQRAFNECSNAWEVVSLVAAAFVLSFLLAALLVALVPFPPFLILVKVALVFIMTTIFYSLLRELALSRCRP